MANFDAVIFDNDGTLVDSEHVTLAVLMEMAIDHGADIRDGDVERFTGSHLQTVFDEIAARAGSPVPDDFIETFRAKQTVMIEAGIDEMPGATELLTHLAAVDMAMAVASNAPTAKMEMCLDSADLTRFFAPRHIVSAYDIEVWKPAPDIFLHAAKLLGVPPERCAVVEDSATGLQAAHAAGMTVFALDTSADGQPEQYPEHTTVLTNLNELIAHL